MNFAETLACWYLRLNGFFVLRDFVFHQVEDAGGQGADCDLLAVRFPYAYERIAERDCAWDDEAFEQWGLAMEKQVMALIVEVKSGGNPPTDQDLANAFSHDRLISAIHRLGIWRRDEVDAVATGLEKKEMWADSKGAVGKLLIANKMPTRNGSTPCLRLTLLQADAFIRDRIKTHILRKGPHRLFFPDDLMQYIIWREGDGQDNTQTQA